MKTKVIQLIIALILATTGEPHPAWSQQISVVAAGAAGAAGADTVVCANAAPLYALTPLGDVITYNAKGKPVTVRLAASMENTLLAQADAKSKGDIKKRNKHFNKAKRKLERKRLNMFKNKKRAKLIKVLCTNAILPGGSLQPPPPPVTVRDDLCSRADQDKNGMVDQNDLMILLGSYGQFDQLSDIDRDGTVDIDDLLIVLALFGQQCTISSSSSSSENESSSSSNSSSSNSPPASSSSNSSAAGNNSSPQSSSSQSSSSQSSSPSSGASSSSESGETSTPQTSTSSSSSVSSSSASSNSSSTAGNARIPIGRWDLVPNQRIRAGETLNLAVVAFSLAGIDRVEFSITGQGYQGINPIVVTAMTDNPQTGAVEYWAPLRASDFQSSGPIQVAATIFGKDGGIRNADVGEGDRGLEVTTLYVDPNNSLQRKEAWIDPLNGNDSTGATGNPLRPYRTVHAGVYNVGAGGVVYLKSGTHTPSNSIAPVTGSEWITVQPAADATRENTILTSPGGDSSVIWQVQKLHLKNLTLLGSNVVQVNSGMSTTSAIWVDGCTLQGQGRLASSVTGDTPGPVSINYGAGYWTDVTISEVRNALPNNWNNQLARNITIASVGDNAFQNVPLIINAQVSNQSPLLDLPKITNATYYPSGTPAYPGYQGVLVKPGAFTDYTWRADEEFRFDMSARNSYTNAINLPKAKVIQNLSNDAIALSAGYDLPSSQTVVSGWLQRNWHSDVWQWAYGSGAGWKGREHNMIVYGLDARDCMYQGISNNSWSDQAQSYPFEGMAFVNVYTACTYGSYWMRLTNHMLLWNVTFNEEMSFFADVGTGGDHNIQSSVTDLSIRGTLFNKCFSDFLSQKPAFGAINFTDAKDNHYRYSGTQCGIATRAPGTDYTTGDPGIDQNGNPLANSPLRDRFAPPLTKRDLDGLVRGSQSAIGAYEN